MTAGEVRTSETHALRAHIGGIGIDHHRPPQISTPQVCSRQIGIAEAGSLQISPIKTSSTEISTFKIGVSQNGSTKIGIAKISTDEVRTFQRRTTKITARTGT